MDFFFLKLLISYFFFEIVNLYELEQKLKVEKENEQLQLPKLIGESKILKDDHLRIVSVLIDLFRLLSFPSHPKRVYNFFKLNCNLIARAVSYDWILTFSTETSGFSLNTLYRTMSEVDSPCLIVVMDTNRNVIAFLLPPAQNGSIVTPIKVLLFFLDIWSHDFM
jgi:hypothetical protein